MNSSFTYNEPLINTLIIQLSVIKTFGFRFSRNLLDIFLRQAIIYIVFSNFVSLYYRFLDGFSKNKREHRLDN